MFMNKMAAIDTLVKTVPSESDSEQDVKIDYSQKIEALKAEYSRQVGTIRFDGFRGLALLSTAGAYFSTLEGSGKDLLKSISIGGADPLSMSGILQLKAQKDSPDIQAFLSTAISYKSIIRKSMLNFEEINEPVVPTQSSNVYMQTNFHLIMESYGIEAVERPRVIELSTAMDTFEGETKNGQTFSFQFQNVEYEYPTEKKITLGLSPTFQPSVKLTHYSKEIISAIASLASISLKCMLDSNGADGQNYYEDYVLMKSLHNDVKKHVETHYFGNTGYVKHLTRIQGIKKINSSLKENLNIFFSSKLDRLFKPFHSNVKLAKAIVGDRTRIVDLATYKQLMQVFPLINRHYWALDQDPISFTTDLRYEHSVTPAGILQELTEHSFIKVNNGSMSGPQYGQTVKREETIGQDAFFAGFMYHANRLIASANVSELVKENMKAALAIAVACFSKPKKEVKDLTAATERFFNVYSAGFNIMNHVFFNVAYFSAAPYKFHADSTSIYKLSLAGGEFCNLIKYARYAMNTGKPFFFNYSDNLWIIELFYIASLDLTRAESQSLRQIAKLEMDRSISALAVADSAIDDAWINQMMNIYPVQSIDSIGIIGNNGYVNAGLGSGQAGTVQLNHINSSALGSSIKLVDGYFKENKETKEAQLHDDVIKVLDATGIKYEISTIAKINHNDHHGEVIRTDILGMDAVYFNKYGINDYYPILTESKMLSAMLYHEGLEEKLKLIPMTKEEEEVITGTMEIDTKEVKNQSKNKDKKKNNPIFMKKYKFAKSYYIREKFKALFLLGGALSDKWCPIIQFVINAANADLDLINMIMNEEEIDVTGFMVDTLSAFVSSDSPIFATLSAIEHMPYLTLEDYFSIMGKQSGWDLKSEGHVFHRVSRQDVYDYFTKWRDPHKFKYFFKWSELNYIDDKGKPVLFKEDKIKKKVAIDIRDGDYVIPGTVIGAIYNVDQKGDIDEKNSHKITCRCYARISFINAFNKTGACIEFLPSKLNINNISNELLTLYLSEINMNNNVTIKPVESDAVIFRDNVLASDELSQRLLLSQKTYNRKIRILVKDKDILPVEGKVNYPSQDTYVYVPLEGQEYDLWFNGMKYVVMAEILSKKDKEFKGLTIYNIIDLLKGQVIGDLDLKEKYGEDFFEKLMLKYIDDFTVKMTTLSMKRSLKRDDSIVPGSVLRKREELYGPDVELTPLALIKEKGIIHVKPEFFTTFGEKVLESNLPYALVKPSYDDTITNDFLNNEKPYEINVGIPKTISNLVGLGYKNMYKPSLFIHFIARQLYGQSGIPMRFLLFDLRHSCKLKWYGRIQWDAVNRQGIIKKFEINLDNYGFYCLRKSVTANPANRTRMTESVDLEALKNVPVVYQVDAPPFKDITPAEFLKYQNSLFAEQNKFAQLEGEVDVALRKIIDEKAAKTRARYADREEADRNRALVKQQRDLKISQGSEKKKEDWYEMTLETDLLPPLDDLFRNEEKDDVASEAPEKIVTKQVRFDIPADEQKALKAPITNSEIIKIVTDVVQKVQQKQMEEFKQKSGYVNDDGHEKKQLIQKEFRVPIPVKKSDVLHVPVIAPKSAVEKFEKMERTVEERETKKSKKKKYDKKTSSKPTRKGTKKGSRIVSIPAQNDISHAVDSYSFGKGDKTLAYTINDEIPEY